MAINGWPLKSMQPTTCEIVEEAKKCANIPYELMNELHSLASPWPYLWWGIDIRTFSKGPPGQVKYLVAVVDYFTKWVKVETLMIITTKNIENFVFRKIICRFRIPNVIVIDNGTQFNDRKFCQLFRIEHHAKIHIRKASSDKRPSQGNKLDYFTRVDE